MQVETQKTEASIIATAREAVSQSNWVVGECAVEWTHGYACGRTDSDFGLLLGLSGDQVRQRRRVFEQFGRGSDTYPNLKWSFFYAALNWDDAAECLSWASEHEATVAEMKAWRQVKNGEDPFSTPEDRASEWGADYSPSPAVNLDASHVPETKETPLAQPSIKKVTAATRKTKPETSGGKGLGPTDSVERASHVQPGEEQLPTGRSAVAPITEAEDAETRALFALRELGQVIRGITEDKHRKKLAGQMRKFANELDPPTKFSPPAIEDVTEYAAEKGWAGFDAEKFWNHYETAGWKYGKAKTPMKNWHSAAANAWERGKGWCSAGEVTSRVHGMDWSGHE